MSSGQSEMAREPGEQRKSHELMNFTSINLNLDKRVCKLIVLMEDYGQEGTQFLVGDDDEPLRNRVVASYPTTEEPMETKIQTPLDIEMDGDLTIISGGGFLMKDYLVYDGEGKVQLIKKNSMPPSRAKKRKMRITLPAADLQKFDNTIKNLHDEFSAVEEYLQEEERQQEQQQNVEATPRKKRRGRGRVSTGWALYGDGLYLERENQLHSLYSHWQGEMQQGDKVELGVLLVEEEDKVQHPPKEPEVQHPPKEPEVQQPPNKPEVRHPQNEPQMRHPPNKADINCVRGRKKRNMTLRRRTKNEWNPSVTLTLLFPLYILSFFLLKSKIIGFYANVKLLVFLET